jgi:uncharacterized protein
VTQDSAARTTADYPVFDADVHIHEEPRELAEFAEGTLRQALEAHKAPERWLDTPGLSPLTAFDPPLGEDPARELHVVRDPATLRADLAELGASGALLFSGRLLGTAGRQDATYPVRIAQTYNRYLSCRWLDPEHGIYGAIMVAAQDPGASAAEIERWATTPGFGAVYLPTASVYPLWGHRQYDPIYAAAQAADLPVVLHGYTCIHSVFPYELEQFDTALAKQVLSKPFGAVANLVSMITTGVFARFPGLRVVFPECGLAWLPPVIWRLDGQYRHLRHEAPEYSELPGEYVRRQVYLTTQPFDVPGDSATLACLVDAVGGPEHVLYASDWPHYDAERPERIAQAPLPPDATGLILGENSRRLFTRRRM